MGVWATGILQLIVCITALSRGLDYITPSDRNIRSLGVVEAAAPLSVWGGLLILGVLTVGFALILDRTGFVALGHLVIAAIYAAIGIGQLSVTIPTQGFDGFRTGVGLFVAGGGVHLVLASVAYVLMRDRRVDRAARAS